MSTKTAGDWPRAVTATVPVLMYHSVAGQAAPGFGRFVTRPGSFLEQLDYLDAAGYQPVTAVSLAMAYRAGRPLPAQPVVLTFDDGFADFADTILPALLARRFRATLYVPTGYVGRTARWLRSCGEGARAMLSWPALRDISREGVEIAAHSHTHPQLDRLPAAEAADEVRRSRRLLEDRLGVAVDGFAYPFGYWSRAARAAVDAEGLRYACAVSELMASPADDVLTLPRLTVNAGISLAGFAALLTTRPTPRARWTAAAKRIAWRGLRSGAGSIGGDPREVSADGPPGVSPA